jgi:hypothetical protein
MESQQKIQRPQGIGNREQQTRPQASAENAKTTGNSPATNFAGLNRM